MNVLDILENVGVTATVEDDRVVLSPMPLPEAARPYVGLATRKAVQEALDDRQRAASGLCVVGKHPTVFWDPENRVARCGACNEVLKKWRVTLVDSTKSRFQDVSTENPNAAAPAGQELPEPKSPLLDIPILEKPPPF